MEPRMRSRQSFVSIWAGLFLAVSVACDVPVLQAQVPTAGQVKTVTGNAVLVRGDQEIALTPGAALREADSIRTDAESAVGLTLRDGTRLSLGPNTNLHMAQFTYAPAENRLGLALTLLQGTIAYISGRIAKLAPSSVIIETPTSIIGVRGTHLVISAEEQ